MKKKIIFCLLSLSLMIAGCQSNEIEDITPPSKEVQLSPEELLSIRYKSSPELSLEKAREFDPLGHAGFDPSGIIRLTP